MKLVRNDVYWNKDSNGVIYPISSIDKYVIDSVDATVQLKDVPVVGSVSVKKLITVLNKDDTIKDFVEIFNGNIDGENEYKINYTTNEMQFHQSQKGKEIIIKCMSEGSVGSSAKNVYVSRGNSDYIGDNVDKLIKDIQFNTSSLEQEVVSARGGKRDLMEKITSMDDIISDNDKSIKEEVTKVNILANDNKNKYEYLKSKIAINSFDFGILPNVEIPQQKLQEYFTFCETNNISAKFGSGDYLILGSNFRLPQDGIEGNGRYETTLKFIQPNNTTEPLMTIGEKDVYFSTRGVIRDIGFKTDDSCTNTMLVMNEPTRATHINNVFFGIRNNIALNILKCFYLNISNTVFEGKYRGQSVPTTTTGFLEGVAIQNDTQVNNIKIDKCEFIFLKNAWVSRTDYYAGSNNIQISNSSFEHIGETVFITKGFWLQVDSCYFEKLYRNFNQSGYSNKHIVGIFGSGHCIFNNCLINFMSIPQRTDIFAFRLMIGNLTLNGGATTERGNIKMTEPVTYGARGLLIDNGCLNSTIANSFLVRDTQQWANVYPTFSSEDNYANQINESRYAKNTLSFQSNRPNNQQYALSDKQAICSIEGKVTDDVILGETKVTLNRFNPTTKGFAWKELLIKYVITSDCPTNITPIIQVISEGGESGLFTDTNLLTKIIMWRRTPVRETGATDYTFHYQIAIDKETFDGATPKYLSNNVTTNLTWIAGSGSKQPSLTIYPQVPHNV